MKVRLFPLVFSALFLGIVSGPAYSEKMSSKRAGEIILGDIYVGSIYIAQENIRDYEGAKLDTLNNGIAITETREITVSGATLVACEAALLEILNKSKNVVSRADCKVKDRDVSAIAPSRINSKDSEIAWK